MVKATLLQKLTDEARYWSRRRKSIQALSRLNECQLKDIGIHRSEIPRAVEEQLPPPEASLLRIGMKDAPHRPASSGFDYGSPLRWLLNSLRSRYEHASRRRELLQLPECLLKDMGVTRGDLYREIHKPFQHP